MQIAERGKRNAIVNFFLRKEHFKMYSAKQLSRFHEQVSREVCRAIQEIIMHHLWTNLPVIIEGDDLIPQFLKKAGRIDERVKEFVLYQPDEDKIREYIIKRDCRMSHQNPALYEKSIKLALEDNRRIAPKAHDVGVRLISTKPIRELTRLVLKEVGDGKT